MTSNRLLRLLGIFYIVVCSSGGHSEITMIANQASEVFCVTQEVSNIGPCQHYDSIESHTLAYYMNHSSEHFKSYETYVFQRGKHNPLDQFTLNISNAVSYTHLTLPTIYSV